MTISDIAVTLTGERMMTKYTGGNELPVTRRDRSARVLLVRDSRAARWARCR